MFSIEMIKSTVISELEKDKDFRKRLRDALFKP